MDRSVIRKRGHYFKKNLSCRESLGLHLWIYISFMSSTLYLDGKFSSVSKSTPNDRQDHHVLVAGVVIMTSQCRCARALSQSHVAKHDNHVPVTPLIGSGLAVMPMQWLPYGKIISAKTLELHSNWGHPSAIVSPTCSWRHNDTRSVQFFLK